MNLTTLGISYKQNYTIFALLCLVYFTKQNVFRVHSCCSMHWIYLLRLSNIPLCVSLRLYGLYSPWSSPAQNNGGRSPSLLQGIFPRQGLNSGLLHYRQTLPAEPLGKPKNTGVGSPSLLQGIFPTQGLNQGLPHCRWILYQLKLHWKKNFACFVHYYIPGT